jgi:hypothetical protein
LVVHCEADDAPSEAKLAAALASGRLGRLKGDADDPTALDALAMAVAVRGLDLPGHDRPPKAGGLLIAASPRLLDLEWQTDARVRTPRQSPGTSGNLLACRS